MRNMPYEIKQAIRQYANIQIKAAKQYEKIVKMVEEYNVPLENLLATATNDLPQTEALAFINNCECGDLEGSIKEIEEVFLWFVKNPQT